ncbi:hypothetical protein RRG08_058017 [Elysia crispata]|uniref:Uncharacterized protein n=1 Tax=Elysia crispata TaxID=231223 RepID=A0AAE1AQ23_9GAST|nr:hypothetical protein RRG08_058017 [Elysia crispata]
MINKVNRSHFCAQIKDTYAEKQQNISGRETIRRASDYGYIHKQNNGGYLKFSINSLLGLSSSESEKESVAKTTSNSENDGACIIDAPQVEISSCQVFTPAVTSRSDDTISQDQIVADVNVSPFRDGGMCGDREEEGTETERKVKRNRTTFSTRQLQGAQKQFRSIALRLLSEESTPVNRQAEPPPTTKPGSGPSTVLSNFSTLQSDDRPGIVSTTRSGRIQRRPLRFRRWLN